MFDLNHFLDSNIIIGYATDFEKVYDKCQKYFDMDISKITGTRVYTEIGKVRVKRRKLYNDLREFINTNNDVEVFEPSVPVNPNDLRHLRELLKELATVPIYKAITYLNRKVRVIEAGIREAFNKIKKPFIKPYNDVTLEIGLNKWIQNMADSKIISDAICWAEENGKIYFCTNDEKDFLSNKEDIYYGVCGVILCEFRDLPLEIVGINEIIL